MVADTSALIAILEGEAAASRLIAALDAADELQISTATVIETGIIVESRRGEAGGHELDLMLHRFRFQIEGVTAEHAEIAREAYRRYGKGRHPAGLNFGDCLVYALAISLDESLLFVGDDFPLTDVRVATY